MIIENKIAELGNNWKAMPRNNAEEITAADRFYNENIMPLSIKKFLDSYAIEAGKYDLMFVTVGTSWQPVALSILAKKPHKVIFLTTADVEQEAINALNFMTKQNYALKDYQIVLVDKAASTSLLKKVWDIYAQIKPNKACFDITGGTKAMAAAAAMIASKLDMDIFYVESNYLPVYRHPEPGSERMVQLDRPQDVA